MPFCSNCLVRAVAAKRLLSFYGYAAELRIGVSKREAGKSAIEAHAWVEKDGKILIGEDEAGSWTALPTV
jgi:hypothetical protein